MEIRKITDRNLWDDFVLNHGPRSGAFLQSFDWGEFLAAGGLPVHRLAVFDKGELRGVCQFALSELPLGKKYALTNRGPILPDVPPETLGQLAKFIQSEFGVMFWRLEPLEKSVEQNKTFKASRALSPKKTLILDLTESESALLAGFHSKTRYNIGLAKRRGVVVEQLAPEEFAEAWQIFKQTGRRDRFNLHSRGHYERLINFFSKSNIAVNLVGARYQGRLIAVNIMLDFSDTRTYLHGASANEYRNVMAPYALHWQQIKQARERGLVYYDWWGISDTDPAWAGITRFKRGFGGQEVSYPGTFDFVFSPGFYRLYQLARRLKYGSRV